MYNFILLVTGVGIEQVGSDSVMVSPFIKRIGSGHGRPVDKVDRACLLYTSDAADE